MRTTLSIDDDVLDAARERSRMEKKPMGQTVSSLLRKALQTDRTAKRRNGVPMFRVVPGAMPIGLDKVNALRDEG